VSQVKISDSLLVRVTDGRFGVRVEASGSVGKVE
jgi:hypothetical protein